MAGVLFKDGLVQFHGGKVQFTSDPAECFCCTGVPNCNSSCGVAMPAYVTITVSGGGGGLAALDGVYICPWLDEYYPGGGGAPFCRYFYFFPTPITCSGMSPMTSIGIAQNSSFFQLGVGGWFSGTVPGGTQTECRTGTQVVVPGDVNPGLPLCSPTPTFTIDVP